MSDRSFCKCIYEFGRGIDPSFCGEKLFLLLHLCYIFFGNRFNWLIFLVVLRPMRKADHAIEQFSVRGNGEKMCINYLLRIGWEVPRFTCLCDSDIRRERIENNRRLPNTN